MRKRTRGNPIPLIVEHHPENYTGYPFITLIQYRKNHYLTLVDNTNEKTVRSYVLDLCGPLKVNEEQLIEVASIWWNGKKDDYPLSFEISRLGLTEEFSRIYKTYNLEYVTRVIGPLPKFHMNKSPSVKRRKRKPLPKGVVINKKEFS